MATIEKRSALDGKISYRVKVRLKGRPSQSATFERLTDAKRWAQHTESAIREGRYFKTIEAKKHTLAEMVNRYVRDVLPHKSESEHFIANQEQQLDWWKEELGSYLLFDVSPALIVEKRDLLRNRGERAPATVNRYLAVLSHVYTIAVREWGWVEDNPLRKVSRLKEPRGRVRFLDDGEREALLAVCEKSELKYLSLIVILALSTGARKMEILRLRWKDVDLKRQTITLHETKNRERRVLPLQARALQMMKEHDKIRTMGTELVFAREKLPRTPILFEPYWQKALEKAEIKDFRFHDLRHSAASYLAMSGATLAEIAEVLGHKTLQMVKRYAHLSEAHTSQVVARMNEHIFGG